MQTKPHNTVLLVKQTIILLGQDSSAVSYCYEKNIPPYFHYCAYKTLNAISFLGILSQFGEISGELWIFFFTILHKKYITLRQKLYWRSNDNLMHLYDTIKVIIEKSRGEVSLFSGARDNWKCFLAYKKFKVFFF